MRILFVDIDTLRADHMGCYGYRRNTTPNLDQVAQDGLVFDNYYCSDAPCLPSRAALISGQFGIHNGAVGHGGTTADRRLSGAHRDFRDYADTENFTNLFRRAGMHTASISTFGERHSSYWFHAGFNEIFDVGKGGMESGEEVLPAALKWIRENGDNDNWYLHVHLWDPHTPYRTPADFESPFYGDDFENWITPEIFNQHLHHTGPHSINELSMYNDSENPSYPKAPGKITNYKELRRVFDEYDNGVYYADYLVGQILDLLKDKGLYEDMAIIITSDHGENMGELGIYSEHGTADQPTCHIPMILKWPGGVPGIRDAQLHYQIDLVPTMAELLGLPISPRWDGQAYTSTVLKGEPQGRDSLVISQMAHVCQRSARFGDWLYMRTYHDGYHLFDREMLFNLKDDPYETQDVKETHPEICAQGAKIILDWQDENMLNSDYEIDPLWTVLKEGGPYHTWTDLPAYIERLRATGREDGAQKLEEKYLKA